MKLASNYHRMGGTANVEGAINPDKFTPESMLYRNKMQFFASGRLGRLDHVDRGHPPSPYVTCKIGNQARLRQTQAHFSAASQALSHRAVNDVRETVAGQILHCKAEVWAEGDIGLLSPCGRE